MEEEELNGNDSDIDIYCDLEEVGEFKKRYEESSSKVNGVSIPDISKLFSENECQVSFCEDGKTTKIMISKQPDNNEDVTNYQAIMAKDFDLFSDVLDAEVTEKMEKVEKEKKQRETLITENYELKRLNSELSSELAIVKKKNTILLKNICSLYKTAKEEVSRKDALIAELRERNDGMIFRRTRLMATGTGVTRRFSRDQQNVGAQAADTEGLSGRNSEFKTKNQNVLPMNSCANGQFSESRPNLLSSNDDGKKSMQRSSADISSISTLENVHKHDLERKKKLPKAFQDPAKLSRRRHSSYKSHGKNKKIRRTTTDSAESGELSHSDGRSPSDCSDVDANHHKSLKKLKNLHRHKRRYKKPVLSSEELRRIYSDYQRSLPDPKRVSKGDTKGKSNLPVSKTDNVSKGNCDSEKTVAARNCLLKKLLEYEKQETVLESERTQRNCYLNKIISHASSVDDFTQLYAGYLAHWALSSLRPSVNTNSHKTNSSVDDNQSSFRQHSEEELPDYEEEVDDDDDFEDNDDYDGQYDYYNGRKTTYVDLDRPKDNFYGAPPKSFYEHLMEEKARQVMTYSLPDNQTKKSCEDLSKVTRKHEGETVISAEKFPTNLKDDSLKLFSYQGQSVPVAVKKRVLGYAKSPKKTTSVLESVNKEASPVVNNNKLKTKSQSVEKPS